jgi:integrase
VVLRVSRLDLLRCTARVVEAAVEVSRLEWGPVKTHEARTVRMSRSVAEEVGAALAARPQDQDALVFTAPMGGPLGRADFVRSHFKPAVRRANEALAKLPKDQRPAPLPEGLRFYDPRHTCASLLIALGASVKGSRRSSAMPPRASRWILTGTCSRRRWRRWPTVSNWSVTRPWRSGHGPSADRQRTVSANAQVGDLFWWRRLRGSNPRGG